MISIFADGSSSGSGGGAGGYGWLIADGDQIIAWGYGGTPETTNNLMEMEGCIQGLEAAISLGLHSNGTLLELVSDSQYALGVGSGTWAATKNLVEVERLQALVKQSGVRLRWVPGHSGIVHNETCDQLAKQGKIENLSTLQRAKYDEKLEKKAKAAKKKALKNQQNKL